MFFDWGCIYSDDKVSNNKGHQYRNGSLKLNSSQQAELKNFFYIPSNFPKIPVISGKWLNNINKMAIGATQILPNEGRTSYITFIIFLSKEECSSIKNIDKILKFITSNPIFLKSICDEVKEKKVSIGELDISVINDKSEAFKKAKNTVITLYDMYQNNQNIKTIIQGNISDIEDYIQVLSSMWLLIFPSVKHEMHWIGPIKYIDIPFQDKPKIIFTEKIAHQWESSFNSKKFLEVNELATTPLSEYFSKTLEDPIHACDFFQSFMGELTDLNLPNNYFTNLKLFNSTDDITSKINNLLSMCSSLNLQFIQEIISEDFYHSNYAILQKDLTNLINKINCIKQSKRFFADRNCLLNDENFILIKEKFIELINCSHSLDKSILAHSVKFLWVKEFLLNIYNNVDIANAGVIESIFSTILQLENNEDIFLNYISNNRDNLFRNILNSKYYQKEIIINNPIILRNLFFKKGWDEFFIVFSIISIQIDDNNKLFLPEILKKIEINSYYIEEFKRLIISTLGGEKFSKLYLELEEFYLLDELKDILLENLITIKNTPISVNILKIISIILPSISKNEKLNIFTQDYFDQLLKLLIDNNLEELITIFLKELNGIGNLHFYNFTFSERQILWTRKWSINYLRPTTLIYISTNKPILTIEEAVFKDINKYIVEHKIKEISMHLVNYLKDPRVIYSVEHHIVLSILLDHMNPSEWSTYISNIKKKRDSFKKIIDLFKSNNKDKYKKIKEYHRVVISNYLSIEEKLEINFPNNLMDVEISHRDWCFSFQKCLTEVIDNRLTLENICNSAGIKYKNFDNGKSISDFVSIVVNQVFDKKIIDSDVFFTSIQSNVGIDDNVVYGNILNHYKIFILLKRYFKIKLMN
ncbi:hypothetical protein [Acinetobacter lwoffii]|uniref:hypothetical protein n=1 Tax=Acinetobacter lwoffii TaxID=28090 RepID=UPI00209AAB81|nr:hypothetical protein [Acinetobacter lwoffii]MCO8063271.1 hypothetical protein [Acinetobacter lwoffii]